MVPFIAEQGFDVSGLDVGFYVENMLKHVVQPVSKQIVMDTRDVAADDLKGFDAVIHLAALSNDPIGELDRRLTFDINLGGTMNVAKASKEAGVKRFLFASSPSMYGISDIDGELPEEGEKHPLTAYAETKWLAEQQLAELGGGDFTVVFIRPATAYGASPNLRCDVVFNNFCGCAYTTKEIRIESDGTPWRPLAHVEDISRAFYAGLCAPKEVVAGKAFNVGVPNGNYTVKEIAVAASKAVDGSKLTFAGKPADSRSYKVSFKRILTELAEWYKPEWNLDKAGAELVELFKETNFTYEDFTGPRTVRIKRLKELLESGRIDSNLRWVK
jgi:nucleoside-diphosphate-sugar epimerase